MDVPTEKVRRKKGDESDEDELIDSGAAAATNTAE